MSESKTQDPKYIVIDGQLANAATREFIPEDEPVFILRGKDIHAYLMLDYYEDRVQDPDHKAAVAKRMEDFDRFRQENSDRMGEPDTVGADDWPDHSGIGAYVGGDDTGNGTDDDLDNNGKEDGSDART